MKYWVCKTTPALVYEAMECLGGNGYVEDGSLARLYREAPVNAIWEGSGNVMALDVLRVFDRDAEASHAMVAGLEREAGDLPGVRDAAAFVATAFAAPDVEATACAAVERLALLAAAAALKAGARAYVAESFARTRLLDRRGGTFGTSALGVGEISALLDRALVLN